MRLCVLCSSLVAVLVSLVHAEPQPRDPYSDFIAPTGPRTPAEEQKCFHLPPGFAIELVASEPAIGKPMNINFDDRGRLWLTQSVEYPFPAPSTRKARDVIKILEDTDGDGVADRITTFADGLNIPIGILPLSHAAMVYSIPNIYRLEDTDGDDRADKKELLYGSIGFQDTHGMTSAFTWGFDGWIYACHGFSNTSEVKAKDGSRVRMQSGNTYRMKPDGSHIEQFTHGQVNPFGLCFDPLGNLFSADCHTRPVMMLLRNAYYESFGKPHDGLGFAPEMCFHDHGSTAIAGIVYYAADQFPPEYRDTVFVGNVVTNRINHDKLERHGSTLLAKEQPDFLTCDDPWFRPVDLKLGPDGAIYVADFYNRIIGHYEVPLTHPGRDRERGRIWRIYYRGTEGKPRPPMPRADWTTAPVSDLVSDLAHPNLVVRMKAANQLVERGGQEGLAAVRLALESRTSPWPRIHALWILERLHALDDASLDRAAHDADRGVRVHVMRILAERPDQTPAQHGLVTTALRDSDAFVQRTAAEALGTHPAPENLAPLLALRHAAPKDDTQLVHMVRMSLRDQLRPAENWGRLAIDSWSEADRAAVADVATGVPTPEAAAYLLGYLQRATRDQSQDVRYAHHVARFGAEGTDAALLAFARGQPKENLGIRAALLRAMQQGAQERGAQLNDAAKTWAGELVSALLASSDAGLASTGAELAGSLGMAKAQPDLSRIAQRKDLPEGLRRAAIDALVAIDGSKQIALLGTLLADAAEPFGFREHLIHLLASTNRPEAHAELLRVLAIAPASLQHAIAAHLSGSSQGAEKLLDAVAAGKASARLLQDWGVHLRVERYSALKERLAKLTQGLAPADERLQKLIQQRHDGFAKATKDPAVGAKVFEKHCAICHQLGGKGAKVGPQLDGVGIRGLDRLLEDIIDPNRNVDQAFRSTTLVLKNGGIQSGLVLREEGEVVILADAQGKEVRIPKSTIEERTVSQLSPMPANLVEQLSEADFYHVLAFLLTQHPQPEKTPGAK